MSLPKYHRLTHVEIGDAEDMRSWCKFCSVDIRFSAWKNPCQGRIGRMQQMASVMDEIRELSSLPTKNKALSRAIDNHEITLERIERDYLMEEFG